MDNLWKKRAALLIVAGIVVFLLTFSLLTVTQGHSQSKGSFFAPKKLEQNAASLPDIAPMEEDIVRLLVCGIDDTRQLTDVILYGVLDTKANQVNILQIPRDSFVGNAYPTGKINAVYGHPLSYSNAQGIYELEKVLEEQFLLPVDYYVTISLKGLRNLVDSLGGVPINLPRVIEYLPGKVLYPGEQVLSGEQAEWFVRYRQGYANGDIGRVDAQAQFIKALIAMAKSKPKLSILNAVVKNYGEISTDIPLYKMLSFANAALELQTEDVALFTAPGTGMMNRSYAVYRLDGLPFAELLNLHFRPQGQNVPLQSLNIQQVPVLPPPPPQMEEPPPIVEEDPQENVDEGWEILELEEENTSNSTEGNWFDSLIDDFKTVPSNTEPVLQK